jgi:hypothetical protein
MILTKVNSIIFPRHPKSSLHPTPQQTADRLSAPQFPNYSLQFSAILSEPLCNNSLKGCVAKGRKGFSQRFAKENFHFPLSPSNY